MERARKGGAIQETCQAGDRLLEPSARREPWKFRRLLSFGRFFKAKPDRLAEQFLILRMRADPEPLDASFNIDNQRPIVDSNPHRPKRTDLLEVQ